jgi:folate-binding protein YgfZ
MPQDNTTISAGSAAAYAAARSGAGIVERFDRGRIVVSGQDRASYLQGLLTNDIAALKSGEGCYAAYLTAQGRMITDIVVYELGDVILLSLGRDVKDAVLAKFDQLIFSEDVQLGDVSDTFGSVAVLGPDAASVVAHAMHIGIDRLERLGDHGNLRAEFAGEPSIVVRTHEFGVPAFEVLVGRSQMAALMAALRQAGAIEIAEETADVIRIESGTPKFHKDMDEETIPLEAGLEANAISFSKGCYVGQEVIIRVLHRGHGRVARKLVGLTIESGPAVAGAVVQADGREIGRVTSAAYSPALKKNIALGYVQRDYIEPGTNVSVNGSPAVVTKLPFVS